MGIIKRLQRLDERLGLDSPQKRQERDERQAALDALPEAMRQSLMRRRLVAMALITATVLATSILVLSLLLPPSHDGWVVATIVLTFIAVLVGGLVGRRIEQNVLAEHRDSGHQRQ